MNTREGRFLPVPHCIRNTPGWALEPEIAQTCTRGMMSFEKPTFGSTALCEYVCTLAAEKLSLIHIFRVQLSSTRIGFPFFIV